MADGLNGSSAIFIYNHIFFRDFLIVNRLGNYSYIIKADRGQRTPTTIGKRPDQSPALPGDFPSQPGRLGVSRKEKKIMATLTYHRQRTVTFCSAA